MKIMKSQNTTFIYTHAKNVVKVVFHVSLSHAAPDSVSILLQINLNINEMEIDNSSRMTYESEFV